MLDATRGVLVAVSGGPDSVAMLDMLMGVGGWGLGVGDDARASIKGASPQPPTPKAQPPSPIPYLHVAHLDHMLRGGESAEDAEFVRALAERLGLKATIGSINVRAAAESLSRGVEEVARELRYRFLLEAANAAGCDRIAVGHTMTDQAETVLMRLIRGAGLRGLAAMRPVSGVPKGRGDELASGRVGEEQMGREGRGYPSPVRRRLSPSLPPPLLIRPLLCVTREEVETYCRERRLDFRTDATNLSLHYTRNRLRNDIMPALRSINPRVVESVARAAENIAGDQDVLDTLAHELLRGARIASDASLPAVKGRAAYSVAALLEQPFGTRRRMIIEAIRFTRAVMTRDEHNTDGEVSSAHVAAVEGLLTANASGKRIALPGSLEVWREFDAIVLQRRAGALPAPLTLLTINATRPRLEAGGFAFTLERGLSIESLGLVIEETYREWNRTGRDWMTVALDDSSLPHDLVIRPRIPGERALVIGHRRTIKLKNLMIDHRIPSSRRASWPLVATPDGAYIWSPGLPPASEFAAHNETRSLAMMRALAL